MYTFDSRIRYSETNSEGQLTMASLINYFQDCSTFQSEDLGVGVEYLKEHNQVWVLSFWQIVVDRYPKLCEKVKIGTQPYQLKGFMGQRNFAMMNEEGEFLAKANSVWSLLDTQTGRPVAIPEKMQEKYELQDKLDMEYAPRKIAIPEEGEVKDGVTVTIQHLDTNHHVNNQQFVDIAMHYLPENFHICEVRAEYRMQAFLGDVLIPRVSVTEDRITVVLTNEEDKPYMLAEFFGRK